jgi:hypothetical protein
MGSLPQHSLRIMRSKFGVVFALLGLAFLGMGDKPDVTVRFFVEANSQDTDHFATPATLKNPPRDAFIEKTPLVSERMVKAIYPFQAADGTWGCSFKLDESGRISLEVVSTTHRGRSIVAFLSTKKGTHQVVDMLVDKPIGDGVITIPYGLTEMEIALLTKEFHVLGQEKKKKK